MGPSTPWKSSLQFLDPPGSQCNPVPGIVLLDKGIEPNVLRGLGSINLGIWGGDHFSDNRHTSVYNGPQMGLPPITRPTQMTNDPKDRQVTSPVGEEAPPSNINNLPPTGSHYGENFPSGGGNPPGRGNPFPGGGGRPFGTGGGGNPPGGGGNSPGGGDNPFPGGGNFPHGFPSFPMGPPPGGGGDGPPEAEGGNLNNSGSSHNRNKWDL